MPQPSHDEAPAPSTAAAVEVAVPLALSHSWVAHACRAAGLPKPRWDHAERAWTARGVDPDGAVEVIRIRAGSRGSSVRVESARGGESATARRIVTALVTGMQWALARREGRDRPL
jgi:hypothetical protein